MESTTDTYDYVVVGGGTAGSVIAARLSESDGPRVLLLEAGTAQTSTDMSTPPAWPALLRTSADWGTPPSRSGPAAPACSSPAGARSAEGPPSTR